MSEESKTASVAHERAAVPPYVPYRTLKNFLEGLKISIPSRIDRSVMGSMSGAIQSQLAASLRYLGLTSDKGLPTERLAKVVNSEGPERQKHLREMVMQAYPFLFKGFDLQRATTRQLEEEFGKVGAGGQTVRKCMAFFMSIAKESEIPLSPHIKPFQGASRAPRQRRATPLGTNGSERELEPIAPASAGPDGNVTWAQLLLSKFPSFDPAWPDDVKAKWFDAFDRLMRQDGNIRGPS
jgi:hypothetical protein